jgi:WD40-like Beta Propeller Repeat
MTDPRHLPHGPRPAALPRRMANALAILIGAATILSLGQSAGRAADGAAPRRAPRIGGSFSVQINPYTVGQAAAWLDQNNVVYQAQAPGGQMQIFRSTLSGGDKVCLTCALTGPNQVPVVQPHGNWILFHSWHGHSVRVGAPGFGGLGSDIWVMTRQGKHITDLTRTTELHDNFHSYWSPDGHYVAWTALNWNAAQGGNGKSDIVVARFDPNGPNGPRLVDQHAVRPANGHWYETQWWAPDGSGFLYTETYGTALNTELFFCHLPDLARGPCRPQRLTNNPAWDEQAVFTPDMRAIVFMSTRDHAGAFNNWSQLATLLDLPASYDYAIILPVFDETFLQPVFQQADDLYEIALRWSGRHTSFAQEGPVRRLTHFGDEGWVIPEFAWDPSGRRLLWTQSRFHDRVDEPTVLRQIRNEIVARLSGVRQLSQVPFDIFSEIRGRVGKLLQDPAAFGPGGKGPSQATAGPIDRETVIGELAQSGP